MKAPFPSSASRPVIWRSAVGDESYEWGVAEALDSAAEETSQSVLVSKGYIMGATFGFPCFESWVGSSTTKADALPNE